MKKIIAGFSAYIEKEIVISDELYDGILNDTADTLEPIYDEVENSIPPYIELGEICCITDEETGNVIAEW